MGRHVCTALAIAVLPVVAAAQETAPRQEAAPGRAEPAGEAAPMTASGYVRSAGISDLYEITSSQVALEDAPSPKVRSFAEMMIADHRATTAQVTAASKAGGMTPQTPRLDEKHSAMIAELKRASGADRQNLYLAQQVQAHREALLLHSSYARNGDNDALKRIATEAVPVVSRHLDMVQRLTGSR